VDPGNLWPLLGQRGGEDVAARRNAIGNSRSWVEINGACEFASGEDVAASIHRYARIGRKHVPFSQCGLK
jgi:hypothetical protein